jgi:SPP1 family predicted phage head-tail adaptor
MTAGKLDQPITIERRTSTKSVSGGFIDTWSTWATVWAGVQAKAGREGLDEGRTNATFVVVFTIYTLSGLMESDRIIWGGVPYNIRGIRREGEQPLEVKIEAERGVAS